MASAEAASASDLNKDCWEYVCSCCSVQDLCRLRCTCKVLGQLLATSERIWLHRLAEDFGLSLKVEGSEEALVSLARRVYEASSASVIRFQAALVTGGVDADAGRYWADNAFKRGADVYCSNSSANADCLALLLDGEVERDAEYAGLRRYMMQRCRYAAALILNVNQPARDPETIADAMLEWSDTRLESFFRDLVQAMNQEHALGRLLVFDIPHSQVPEEVERLNRVEAFLRERPGAIMRAMRKLPDDGNVMFDASLMPKLGKARLAGIIKEVSVSRAGNLTCPVATGAIFVGTVDFRRLAKLSPSAVTTALHKATQDPACRAFDSLSRPEDVERACRAGALPPVLATDETAAGLWHEFDTRHGPAEEQQQAAGGEEERPLITWKPLVWFRFSRHEEMEAFAGRYPALVEQWQGQARVRHAGPAPQGKLGLRYLHGASLSDAISAQAQAAEQSAAGRPLEQLLRGVESEAASQRPASRGAINSLMDEVAGPGPSSGQAVGQAGSHGGAGPSGGLQHAHSFGADNSSSDDEFLEVEEGFSSDDGEEGEEQLGGGQAAGAVLPPAWFADWHEGDLEQGQHPVVAGEGLLPFEDGGGDESEEDEEAAPEARTRGRSLLHIALTRPCSANVACVKLISQENLMEALGDPHTWPNIDLTHVVFQGKAVRLPKGVSMAAP